MCLQGWFHYNILTDLLGDGIFTVDGEKWRHQRKESSYEFSTKILKNFSSVVFKTNAVKLSRILSEAVSSNKTIEIQVKFWPRKYYKYSYFISLEYGLTL